MILSLFGLSLGFPCRTSLGWNQRNEPTQRGIDGVRIGEVGPHVGRKGDHPRDRAIMRDGIAYFE